MSSDTIISRRPGTRASHSLDTAAPTAFVPLSPSVRAPEGFGVHLKHAIGRTTAGLALLVLMPLLLLVALLVKLSSPGPVLFRQRRVGQDGRRFDMFKFRSMSAGAAEAFDLTDGMAPGGVEGADRRTTVGRFLRRTSIDELPQLLNVVRGEMVLVGPRPERPEFVERFADEVPLYSQRHVMRPGITGLAQVRGLRGQTSIDARAAADVEYIRDWSLMLDVKVLALTARAVWQPAE